MDAPHRTRPADEDNSPSTLVRARGLLRTHGPILMRWAVALDRADAHLAEQPGFHPRRYVNEVEDMAFDQLCEGDDAPLLSIEDWYAGLPERAADERLEMERA